MGDLAASGRERVRRFVRAVVVFVVGFGAGAVWMASRDVSLPSLAHVEHGRPRLANQVGFFTGTIELTNDAKREAKVLVTVRVYDGDRKVADLAARAVVPPHGEEELTLRSKDRYRTYTGTRVLVAPLP